MLCSERSERFQAKKLMNNAISKATLMPIQPRQESKQKTLTNGQHGKYVRQKQADKERQADEHICNQTYSQL